MIASASYDCTVKLWGLDGRELQTFVGHSHWVSSVNFSPDGQTLASASKDGTVILWNLDLEDLLVLGCDRLRDYLKTNPNVSQSDAYGAANAGRTLCDGICTQN
jgi:WD40 repeat protein